MPLRFRVLPATDQGARAAAAPVGHEQTVDRARERTFELTEDLAEVRLGRQPTVEIELPFPAVSLLHARLFRGESAHEWWLEDQGSTNGTWLEGQRLTPRRPVLIRAGQRMRVGSVELVFEGWAPTVRGGESTATIARRLISDLFSAPGNDAPVLVLEAGRAAPTVLRLTERDRRYLVGRADSCDLVVGGDRASREHAAFERRWDGIFLSDLGSRNGVLINGDAVAGTHRLKDGDVIQLGGATVRLTDPEERYLRGLEAGEGEPSGDAAKAPPASERSVAASARTPIPHGARPIGELPRTTPPPPTAAPAARRASSPPDQGLSRRRKVAMALAAAVLVVAVAGLILLLVG